MDINLKTLKTLWCSPPPYLIHIFHFLLFILGYFVMRPGLITDLSQGYIAGARGDAGIYVYLFIQNISHLFSLNSTWFNINIFYPYGGALGFSDNFILPSLLGWPLLKLLNSTTLAYNIIIISAGILNGYCTYLLSNELTKSRSISIWAGFAFMSQLYFASHSGHPQLQFAFFIPLTLYFTIKYCETRGKLFATAIGITVAAAFYSAVYYAMFSYLLAGTTLLIYSACKWKTITRKDVTDLVIAALPGLILISPAAMEYHNTALSLGEVATSVIKQHSPNLIAYLAAPRSSISWGLLTHQLGRMEGFLFPGLLTIIFALFAVSRYSISNSHIRSWCLCFLIGILISSLLKHLSLGQEYMYTWSLSLFLWLAFVILFISAIRSSDSEQKLTEAQIINLILMLFTTFFFASLGFIGSRNIHLPFPEIYKLIYWLPGFSALRGIERLGIVTNLLLILIVSLGITSRLRKYSFAHYDKISILVTCVLILLSSIDLRVRKDIIPYLHTPPRIYEKLDTLQRNDALVALPIGSPLTNGRDSMNWNTTYMVWMAGYNFKIVNGFSGKVPLYHQRRANFLDSFPSSESLSLLGQLVGVNHVLINSKYYGKSKASKIIKRAKKLPEQITNITCDRSMNCLLEVQPIIDFSLLKEKMLLIPAYGSKTKTIEFDIKDNLGNVTTNITAKVVKSQTVQQISITPSEKWQHVRMQIAAPSRTINPIAISFDYPHDSGSNIWIKSIQINSKEQA